MAQSAATLLVEVSADLRKFKRGMADMQSTVQKTAKSAKRAGKALTAAVTLPILGAGAAAVKTAGDFEESMSKIETLVGQSADQVDAWGKEITRLAPTIGRTPQELADALFVVTSAGQRGAEALEIVEQAGKAAAIGLGQTNEIARSVTAAMNAYGKENLSAARATDVLLSTIREGNVEAASLAPVLGRVIAVASEMGVSFEEVGANIATFTRLGVSAEEAVTGLRTVLSQLLNPTKEAKETLQEAGLSADGLRRAIREKGLMTTLRMLMQRFEGNEEAIGNLFGDIQGLTNVLATAGSQGETYANILGNIRDETADVDTEFEKMSKDLKQQIKELRASFSALAVELGTDLLPMAKDLVGSARELTGWFSDLEGSTKELIIVMGGFAAAMGPVIWAAGALVSSLSTLAGIVGTGGLLITGIGALAAAFTTLGIAAKDTGGAVEGLAGARGAGPMTYIPKRANEAKQAVNNLSESMRQAGRAGLTMGKNIKQAMDFDMDALIGDPFAGFRRRLEGRANERDTAKTAGGMLQERADQMTQDLGPATPLNEVLSAEDLKLPPRQDPTIDLVGRVQEATRRVQRSKQAMVKSLQDLQMRGGESIKAVSANILRIPKDMAVANEQLYPELDATAVRFRQVGKAIATGFVGSIGRAIGETVLEIRSLGDALSSVGSIAKRALSGILGTAAQAGLTSLIAPGGFMSIFSNLIGVPGLAHGGIVTGPQLIMAGEGREDEAVIPLSRLESMINTGGGGTLTARVSGDDLLFILNRAQQKHAT